MTTSEGLQDIKAIQTLLWEKETVFTKRFQRVYIFGISESAMFLFLASFCIHSCMYFELFRSRFVANDGYPLSCSNMSEFNVFCVVVVVLYVFSTFTSLV